MIVLIDTSTSLCVVTLTNRTTSETYEWQAGRGLAKGLLSFLRDCLAKQNQTINDITALGVFRGPGSFTGLRIGLTVANTIANDLHIPIVGTSGDLWKREAIQRLHDSEDDRLVMPHYGSPAHITKPLH